MDCSYPGSSVPGISQWHRSGFAPFPSPGMEPRCLLPQQAFLYRATRRLQLIVTTCQCFSGRQSIDCHQHRGAWGHKVWTGCWRTTTNSQPNFLHHGHFYFGLLCHHKRSMINHWKDTGTSLTLLSPAESDSAHFSPQQETIWGIIEKIKIPSWRANVSSLRAVRSAYLGGRGGHRPGASPPRNVWPPPRRRGLGRARAHAFMRAPSQTCLCACASSPGSSLCACTSPAGRCCAAARCAVPRKWCPLTPLWLSLALHQSEPEGAGESVGEAGPAVLPLSPPPGVWGGAGGWHTSSLSQPPSYLQKLSQSQKCCFSPCWGSKVLSTPTSKTTLMCFLVNTRSIKCNMVTMHHEKVLACINWECQYHHFIVKFCFCDSNESLLTPFKWLNIFRVIGV